MDVIGHAANPIAFASGIPNDRGEVRKQLGKNFRVKDRSSILRTEDHMDNKHRQRLRHSAQYRSGLQPSNTLSIPRTCGVAPRWYRVAPLALLFTGVTLITGCKSAPAPTPAPSTPVVTKSAYPPRPTIAPPPFRVFHTTDNSITLVTVPNATDEQIEAILWKLHDAARAHTFDQLLISQRLVDARNPIIWFHLYRGPKCADEKYTTDALPCGPSYHAAGDYTLGSFSNKNRDDGILLHADGHQTELWNPDAH